LLVKSFYIIAFSAILSENMGAAAVDWTPSTLSNSLIHDTPKTETLRAIAVNSQITLIASC
jgi:hypothetical protein